MEFVRQLGYRTPDAARAGTRFSPFLACVAFAASDEQHREHEAHEHGHGTLDIVVEGEELAIELRIPAVNVVGFEHAPRDEAEREAIRKALAAVRGRRIGTGAARRRRSARSRRRKPRSGAMAGEDDHEGEEGHGGGESVMGTRRKSTGRKSTRSTSTRSTTPTPARRSIRSCTRRIISTVMHLEKLDRIDVRVFEHLHGAEEIDVRIVTPTAQLAMELHPGETVVELSP